MGLIRKAKALFKKKPLNKKTRKILNAKRVSFKTSELVKDLGKDVYFDGRRHSMKELAKKPDERLTEVFISGLKDKDLMVRIDAARALGKIFGNKSAKALLNSLKKDKAMQVKIEAAISLGEIGSEKALPELFKLLQKYDFEEARTSLAWAIGQISLKIIGKETGLRNYLPTVMKNLAPEEPADAIILYAISKGKISGPAINDTILKANARQGRKMLKEKNGLKKFMEELGLK